MSSSACACSIGTPGFNRPTATCQTDRGEVSMSESARPRTTCTIAIGAHRSVPIIDDPWNPASATPTTENSRLFRISGRSRIVGSLLNRLVHRAWLSTTTGRSPGTSSSSSRKKRPSVGFVPSTEK